MGFSTILDIIGSIIVGGFLMLLLWRLDDAAVQNVYNNSEELILQRNLVTSVTILENDFRRIGYCKDYTLLRTTDAIISATDTSIIFLTDIGDNSTVDTVSYYIGPASEVTSTPNPRDRFLYRVINNETPVGVSLGITEFRLVYFDVFGDSLQTPVIIVPNQSTISSIEINVKVENVAGYGGSSSEDEKNKYSTAYWRQIRLASMNLNKR